MKHLRSFILDTFYLLYLDAIRMELPNTVLARKDNVITRSLSELWNYHEALLPILRIKIQNNSNPYYISESSTFC